MYVPACETRRIDAVRRDDPEILDVSVVSRIDRVEHIAHELSIWRDRRVQNGAYAHQPINGEYVCLRSCRVGDC